MSKDEARKLLGGYATGSISEAERTVLLQAALEDQELFDELADEQALKEVLDEPGARQRLIAVLEPPRRHRAWLWATAAATLAIAVVIGVVVSQRTQPPRQQIAQVLKSPEPAASPVTPPAAAPAPVKRKRAPATLPTPTPPAELKEEAAAAVDQIQEAKPQAATGAVRQLAASRATSAFAFDYAVRGDGFLEMIPAAPGFLSVLTPNNGVIFPTGSVSAGTPIRIRIPSDASSLIVTFSRTQGLIGSPVRRDALSGTVIDQDPPNGKILIQLSLTPATR
jgi:hypothetical protein